MSGNKRNASPTVSRVYRAAPDECARALQFLLKATLSKEAAQPAAPNEAKGSQHDRPTTPIIPQ